MPAILGFYSSTLVALTEAEVVVLREAVDAIFWILSHAKFHSLLANLEHLGIGETELTIAVVTLAVAKAKVLRMSGKKLFNGNEPLHRMRTIISFYVAVFVCRRAPLHVLKSMGTPPFIISHEIIAVTIYYEWFLGVVQPRHLPLFILGNNRAFWSKPMDAELLLEKSENTIHRSSLRTTPNEKVVANGFVGKALVFCFWLLCACQSSHSLIETHKDIAPRSRQVGSDLQSHATHPLDVLLQFPSRSLLRSRGFRRNCYLVIALPVSEKPIGST